jgi:RNA polymerase sigma-70 factor (ECF subfamily)
MGQVAYAAVDQVEEMDDSAFEGEATREDRDDAVPPQSDLDECSLVKRLRKGDEAVFTLLVERHHASLVRLAMCHVPDRSIAEEVVQDTWVALLEGLDRFEGRSSLKTWLYRILINKAKDRGVREHRSVPFSPASHEEDEADELAVDPSRFVHSGPHTDRWGETPRYWDVNTPERLFLSKETGLYLEKAIAALPPVQRQVLGLHDIEGLSAQEICKIVGISQTNGYVLLHRARSRVRTALERYLEREQPMPRRTKREMARANARLA